MLKRYLTAAIRDARDKVVKEITDQGHVASGKLIDIKISVDYTTDEISAYLEMEDYAEKIDIGGFLTAGYRTMLKWARMKEPGYTDSEQKALARGSSRVTSPTTNAYSWTKNGRRTEWSKYALDNNINEIYKKIQVDKVLDAVINDFVR